MLSRGLLIRATLLEPFPDTFGVVSRTVDMFITSRWGSSQEKPLLTLPNLVRRGIATMEETAD
jgi:hypothetical protein